jgi:hypothetical protein
MTYFTNYGALIYSESGIYQQVTVGYTTQEN